MAGSAAEVATASPALSCTYTHPPNDKSCSNTEKQFSVLSYICCNLLFLAEVKINCLWVGFHNLDHLPLVPALSWASNWPSQGHNLFELKAQKIVLPKCYLQLHILALLSTAIASMTVPCNAATFATLIAHASICLGCTTSLSLSKHHWGKTANTSSLRCINWRFFKLRIK